jgi:acyl-CoA thioester hydrolase
MTTVAHFGESDVYITVSVEMEIPFQDCDPMGVTWHGNYFRYLELARSALLNRIGYNYAQMSASGYAWPIVDTRLKYIKPTTFAERIIVSASLAEFLNRLKINYEIKNRATGELVTRGYTIQMAVVMDGGESSFCSPTELIEKVRECAKSG